MRLTDEAKHDPQFVTYLSRQRLEIQRYMVWCYLTNGRDWDILQAIQLGVGRHGDGQVAVGIMASACLLTLGKASFKALYPPSSDWSAPGSIKHTLCLRCVSLVLQSLRLLNGA